MSVAQCLPRPGGGGVRMGSPDPAHSADPDARRRTRRLVYHVTTGGWNAGIASATGWVVGIAIFFLPFALGGLGAGDVKLLGAIGAWLGPMNALWVGLYAGAAGGILAIFVALTKGYLIQAVGNVGVMLAYSRMNGRQAAARDHARA